MRPSSRGNTMRKTVIALSLLAAGCTGTGVMEVGQNRYRVTQEAMLSASDAEAAVIRQANEFCAKKGQQAEIQISDSRPATLHAYPSASGNFACVPQ